MSEILLSSTLLNNLIFINIKYNSLNIKLSNSKLDKLKSAKKYKKKTEVVLRLSSNMIGDNGKNFPHKLLLTNRQVVSLRKAFAGNHQMI